MKQYLIGIVAAPSDKSTLNHESLSAFAKDLGFVCSIQTVDPIQEIATLREWIEECHKANAFAFIALDDSTGTLGVLLYGFTHLPVLRIPRENTAIVSHLPAVRTIEQAILHLSRFAKNRNDDIDETVPAQRIQRDLFSDEMPIEDETGHEVEDREELELIDKAFREKGWLSSTLSNEHAPQPCETPSSAAPPKHIILDYTPALRSAIILSRHLALRDNTDEISPLLLLEAFMATDNSASAEAVHRLCDDPRVLYEFIANIPHVNLKQPVALIPLAEQAMRCIELAKDFARKDERVFIDTFDVMRAILFVEQQHMDLLREWGVDPQLLMDDKLSFDLVDEYAPVREEEERRERIRPRKPLSTRELSALMQQVPQHLLPRKQPMPEPQKTKEATPKEIKLEKSAVKEPTVLTPNSIRRFSQDNPPLDLVEQVCDALLGGNVIGMPTDTTYVLAVDATNAKAVDKLLSIKPQTENSPLTILFDTPTSLQNLITGYSQAVRKLTNIGWPGGLIVKLRRKGSALRHASTDGNLFLRQPSSYPVLAIIGMLGRPIAVIDSGCDNANKVRKVFANQLRMILDTGMDGTGMELLVDGTGEMPVVLRNAEYIAPEVLDYLNEIGGQ